MFSEALMRIAFGLILLYSLVSIFYSVFYLEGYLGLLPCVLCITERFGYFLIAGLSALSLCFNPKKWRHLLRFFVGLMVFVALVILLVSFRHIYLQLFAGNDAVACLPSLEEVGLLMRFVGTSDCARIQFTILGLPISVQVALATTALLVYLGVLFRLLRKKAKNSLR